MNKQISIDDIIITKSIFHEMNLVNSRFILSEKLYEGGIDFNDILRKHIYRMLCTDDADICTFHDDSPFLKLMKDGEHDFVEMSQEYAKQYYDLMYQYPDIPSGILFVIECRVRTKLYIALLKMNFVADYCTKIKNDGENSSAEVISVNNIVPVKRQLVEGAIIDEADYSIRLIEKKYTVNGEKRNCWSELFLYCKKVPSVKYQIGIVKKAMQIAAMDGVPVGEEHEDINVKNYIETFETVCNVMSRDGEINVSKIADEVFADPGKKDVYMSMIEKRDLQNCIMRPVNDMVMRPLSHHKIVTDNGIEILIPVNDSSAVDNIKFDSESGELTITIKKIGSISLK